ncbi:hypothetical protein HYV86_04660 [Candidatus Woesearchaeota archaeon]|nr:hypothetical protein [Candidatus Woesearchaeota archaeon]
MLTLSNTLSKIGYTSLFAAGLYLTAETSLAAGEINTWRTAYLEKARDRNPTLQVDTSSFLKREYSFTALESSCFAGAKVVCTLEKTALKEPEWFKRSGPMGYEITNVTLDGMSQELSPRIIDECWQTYNPYGFKIKEGSRRGAGQLLGGIIYLALFD